MKAVLSVLFLFAGLLPAQIPFDHARVTTGGYTFLAVWVGEMDHPVLVPLTGPGPLSQWLPGDADAPPDSFKVTYVATNGALVEITVDCTKRSTEECLAVFKRRVDSMTKWLPIDQEATRRWREARRPA